ncbi:uncharacterized transporter [[Candida] railenensis]|uniref:Uncharacterized transporter n=1 Tax=[Candida] railenensis TaxID=45579 RepID=A0A9P0QTB2_9ASCO|nr:uncharacterized transporter [[Candida] railenensis]
MSVPLGTIIYSAVKPIFKIYLIIGLGYLLAKKNILSVVTCRDISNLVVSAIMPCLIFYNIVTYLKSSDIKNIGVIFFTGTLLFSTGCALAFAISIVTRSPKKWLGGILSVGLFPNISDLPIAYLQTLSQSGNIFTETEGNRGVAYVCIFLASQVFYQFSLGLYRLIEWDFRDELEGDAEDLEKNEDAVELSDVPESPQSSRVMKSASEAPKNESSSKDSNNEDENDDTTSIESEKSDINQTNSLSQMPQQLVSDADQDRSEQSQHSAFYSRKHALAKTLSGRRSSITSTSSGALSVPVVSSDYLSLRLSHTRDSHDSKSAPQDIQDVINEYSQFEDLKLMKSLTSTSKIAPPNEAAAPSIHGANESFLARNASRDSNNSLPGSTGKVSKLQRFKTEGLQVLRNFMAPNSLSLIISIALAMSPPLKALFVASTSFHIPTAPDDKPPLSFIMDFTSYVGAASVPLGLLLLGATISRLQIKTMPPGFWKTALAITLTRLVFIPIIGVGLTTGFHKGGWYGDDKLVRFVSVLEFGLPSATALVYFTAFYTNPNSKEHLQMDCLAVCLIFQYSLLFITLPFLVTFTLKVSLGM